MARRSALLAPDGRVAGLLGHPGGGANKRAGKESHGFSFWKNWV